MKNTLRRIEAFPAFDRDGIAGRLGKMAERGWMIEKIGLFYWLYRRTPPRELTFHVSFFPVSSPFCPSPDPGDEEFARMYGHSGWTLAAKNQRMRVFYSEDKAAVPVETDPYVDTAAVHSVAMRAFVPMSAALFLCAVYMLLGAAEDLLFGGAVLGLSALSTAFGAAISVIVAIYYALELTAYFSCYIRAKRAAVAGGRARYANVGGALRFLQWAAFVTTLTWGVCAAVFAAGPERFTAALILWMFIMFECASGLADRLSRAGVSQRANRALTAGASAVFFAAAVFFGAAI